MDEEFFLNLGLAMISINVVRRSSPNTEDSRFSAFFGASPLICSILWEMLGSTFLDFDPYCQPKHLLWTLYFLHAYPTERVMACVLGADEKTIRKWVWYVLFLLADLEDDIICWEDRFLMWRGGSCLITIDCTDCKINEPKPLNKKWFSYKFHGAGLRYEIGICIQTGLIVWINGPYPCGVVNDLSIFRCSMIFQLEEWEMVEADEGYQGQPNKVRIKNEPNVTEAQFIAKSRARARHEAVNGRLKAFKILGSCYHHNIHKHGLVFRAVAVIVQLTMKHGQPTFHVDYPAPGNFY